MKQHRIPDPPPITDRMADGAYGTGAHDLVGTITTVYEIPDSDRRETLLRFDDGRVIQISCDPRYNDDHVTRDPERWEVVLYDSTDTSAGHAMQGLEVGHWL